ncbi:TIGR00730 family Rossman fold protein [uncultured Bacteroides sp.]|uniref:LOG family protein n=1 Tax=uncultured Bacteroides sp. TaxID=162156 RepID=UPI002AABC157|nr:TIGR00730 family Rossman fold protein [uncultured Bacteroides sp.]
MDKIGIFCSASQTIDDVYFQKTKELGKWMGEQGKTLVYGGANMGLMECVALTVKQGGGNIIGVIPAKLEENERVSSLPDRFLHTKNLSDRKDLMLAESDVLIALPGGIGTLDEIFHVMASASIGYHSKKIIFYNINGFYNELLTILSMFEEKQFTRHKLSHYYDVANTFNELTNLLNKQPNNHD